MMSAQDAEIVEKLKFREARLFQDQIIAVRANNPNYTRLVMKNLAKDENVHMTFTIPTNGDPDLHITNETTKEHQPISIPLFLRFLSITFRDFGHFIQSFDNSERRFCKLPAVLMRAPLFEIVVNGRKLFMNVKESMVVLGNVSMIQRTDFIMGFVDDWKTGEQYMLFNRDNHLYRIPILALVKHMVKCLKESTEMTVAEKNVMKLGECEVEKFSSCLAKHVKRIFYFIQPLYYRLLIRLYAQSL